MQNSGFEDLLRGVPPLTDRTAVSCKICGKKYAHQSGVSRHIKKDHSAHSAVTADPGQGEPLLPPAANKTHGNPLHLIQPGPRVYILKSSENRQVFVGCKSAPLGCHTYLGLRNTMLSTPAENFANVLRPRPALPSGCVAAVPVSNIRSSPVKRAHDSIVMTDECPENTPATAEQPVDTESTIRTLCAAATVNAAQIRTASTAQNEERVISRRVDIATSLPVEDRADILLQTDDIPRVLEEHSESLVQPPCPSPSQRNGSCRLWNRKKRQPTMRMSGRTLRRRQRDTLLAAARVNGENADMSSAPAKGAACLGMYLSLMKHTSAKKLHTFFKEFPVSSKKRLAILSAIMPSSHVHSVANKVRSLRYLYSGKRVLSQPQYQDIINANRECNYDGFVRPIPYKKLIRECEQLQPDEAKMQKLPVIEGEAPVHGGRKSLKVLLCQIADSLLKMNEIEEGFASRQWDTDGAFVMGYTVGADACPAGAKDLTSYLITPVNVLRHVSSMDHCHLLVVGECKEDSRVMLKVTEEISAEVEEIEGKRFDLGSGRSVIFKCFGLVGDQKFISTVSGELNNAFRYPREAYHRWNYDAKLLDLEETGAVPKRGSARTAALNDMNARATRTETMPSISAFLHERIAPDPLHMNILAWKEWFFRLLYIVCDLTFDVHISNFKSGGFGKKPLREVMELHPDIPLVALIKLFRVIDSSMFRKIERNFNNNGLVNGIGFKGKDARTLSSNYARICELLLSIVTRPESAVDLSNESLNAADAVGSSDAGGSSDVVGSSDAVDSSAPPPQKRVKLTAVSSKANATFKVPAAAKKKPTAAEKKAAAAAEAEAVGAKKRAAKLFHPYQRIRVIGLLYTAKMLQKCCSIYCSIAMNRQKLRRLELYAERYLAAVKIEESSVKAIHVHVGRAIPYYCDRVFSQYGVGLGAMDLNGREANHQLLKYQSLHAGTSSGDPHKHWQRVFVHDYVRKIHLPLLRRKPTKVNPNCLNYTPYFPQGPVPFCDCGLPKITGRCKLCDSTEFDMIGRSAQKHDAVSELLDLSNSFKKLYPSNTKDKAEVQEV